MDSIVTGIIVLLHHCQQQINVEFCVQYLTIKELI